VETNENYLLMGDSGTHDGTIRVRALAGSSVHRLEILVDGCLQETVAGHTADKTYTVSGTRHYIYVKAIREPSDGAVQVVWSSPVYLSP
jgi:hypothetical protein